MTQQAPPPVLPYGSRARCPRCGHGENKPVGFTWWGGVLGPKMLSHVKCTGCGFAYNGKTGQPNTTAIIIYTVVVGVIGIILGVLVFGLMKL
jgi:rubredoxin